MNVPIIPVALLYSIAVTLIANSFLLIQQQPLLLLLLIPAFLATNLLAGTRLPKTGNRKRRICCHGTVLLYAFYVSLVISLTWHGILAFNMIPDNLRTFLWSALVCLVVNLVIFWNGILCVYLTSAQLGIKTRLLGLIFGMIPPVNLMILARILNITTKECRFEIRKERINAQRKQDQVCATRYPLLLVHGVFFRDSRYFNYWGRIPEELETNGAVIYYGNQASAASVADCAAELTAQIDTVLSQTGAEKVNIIAHSKGGLDCRYAISQLGIGGKVASLTTVNTPHRGCLFADYLLSRIPVKTQNQVASAYNNTLKSLGEANPDFLAAVNDLTDAACGKRNAFLQMPEGIYCQSIGSIMPKASGGKFPLNLSYHLVKHFNGANDGLVSEDSFQWGEKYILLTPTKKHGISHADMIDLSRKNVDGFDVREFYVQLVRELKDRGL